MNSPLVLQEDLTEKAFSALSKVKEVAVDCEMMGLEVRRDRLCVVQIATENGLCFIVQINEQNEAANLRHILTDENIVKVFHFARMDMLFLKERLGIEVKNVYCTKIASRLARTYTDRHGLKDIVREFVQENMDKSQQNSDWGRTTLKPEQIRYAVSDVLHLFIVKKRLDEILLREGRRELVQKLFDFLPVRCELDLLSFKDIFEH